MSQVVRAIGFALFMSAIGYLGWWWLRLPSVADAPLWPAVVLDALLFIAFAVHHSVLARQFARRRVERLIPPHLVRSSYVWVASLLLLAVCMAWRPVGHTLYHATGVAAFGLGLLQLAGVVLGASAVRRISVRELGGLEGAHPTGMLEVTGPFRLVRHPLYLGVITLLFGSAHMTGDRLLFAGLATLYIVVAMPFEEAGLEAQFGARYVEYRTAVRWRLIPYIH